MTVSWEIRQGDCIEVMRAMPDCSVDAIVTDPPYGLEFMGTEWDRLGDIGKAKNRGMSNGRFKGFVMPESYNADANVKCRACGRWKKDHAERKCTCAQPDFPNVKAHQARTMQDWHEVWAREAVRVLKPGGHLLAFGGTRTFHRLTCAIEDAGFEIRDCLSWLYGSGFPKSMDVGKAIDKAAGIDREILGERVSAYGTDTATGGRVSRDGGGAGLWVGSDAKTVPLTGGPVTPEAEAWDGWGTALKPGWEPIVVARKPLDGTVAANVLAHGTGAINVDGCRIGTGGDRASGGPRPNRQGDPDWRMSEGGDRPEGGRWPANVLLSHSEDCVLVGERRVRGAGWRESDGGNFDGAVYGGRTNQGAQGRHYTDEDGLESTELWACVPGCPIRSLDEQSGELTSGANPIRRGSGGASRYFYCAKASRVERNAGHSTARANSHPTVKPIDLMRWLVRLVVTPPDGMVLDPFTGSGTTGCAAVLEGFAFVGIEREAEYVAIAEARIAWWAAHPEGVETAKVYAAERKRAETAAAGQAGLFDEAAA